MRDSTVDDAVQGLRAEFGEAGEAAAAAIEQWSSGTLPFVHEATLAAFVERAPRELLLDSFWQTVPFGTGGRRGTVGVGPNRINHTIVGVTIQGHADFLRAQPVGADAAVVVANDVRVFNDISGALSFLTEEENALLGASSRTFARLAAEIYAANGIRVYFPDPHAPDAVLTTPELSYSVRELNAAGGINLSASHNPPDDNGIKIYDGNGAQFVAPWDDALNQAVANPSPVQWMEFDDALGKGLIEAIPARVHDSYVTLYTEEFDRTKGGLSTGGRVVYTPLCGSGLSSAGEVLTAIGVDVLVPPGQGPDGSFASLPFRAPNPEVPQATDPARRFADAEGVGCVISTDPDADRIGVDVLHRGSWVHLSGNQIAAILGHFLVNDEDGPRRSGLVIETLVTTKLLREIAERSPECQVVDDLLVGFKYVAEVLRSLEESGTYRGVSAAPGDLVLAAEESHGILTVPGIRDKDATSAAIYLAPLHSTLAERDWTLVDYFEHILDVYGIFGETARSIVLRGNRGVRRMADLMSSLRVDPPSSIAGRPVRERLDYWDETAFGPFLSDSDRLSRNVVQWKADGLIVTVRPSGTEPKLKLYVQTTPEYEAANDLPDDGSLMERATAAASLAAAQVYVEILERMGHRLSEAAALLPDLVELDQKLAFDETIAPELLERLQRGETTEAIAWLREATQRMVPGADPLPALVATLQSLVAKGGVAEAEAFLDLVRGALEPDTPTDSR